MNNTDNINLSENLFKCISSICSEFIVFCDFAAERVYCSEALSNTFEVDEKMPGEIFYDFISGIMDPEDLKRHKEKLASGVSLFTGEYRLDTQGGHYVFFGKTSVVYGSDGKPVYSCTSVIEQNSAVSLSTHMIENSHFKADVSRDIENGELDGGILCLSLSDILHHNTHRSHSFVNRVFAEIVKDLRRLCPRNTRLYRVQGNNIVIYYKHASRADVEALFEKIKTAVPEELGKDDRFEHLDIKLAGAAVMISDIDDPHFEYIWRGLSYCATLAIEKDKFDSPIFFSPEKFSHTITRMNLIDELRYCVNHEIESFKLYYQPIIDPKTNKIKSAEELLRWEKQFELGYNTEQIVTELENTGLIKPLGRWIISTSLTELKLWHEYNSDVHININVAIPQLSDNGLIPFIKNQFEEKDIDPGFITFELTETTEIKDIALLRKFIDEIHAIGSEVALDDFGTGSSSMTEIKYLPVDWIKIDHGFVLDIANNKVDRNILKSLADLSHSLDIKICVEGVASGETLEIVDKVLPECVQGYHYSTPLPEREFFEKFIKNSK